MKPTDPTGESATTNTATRTEHGIREKVAFDVNAALSRLATRQDLREPVVKSAADRAGD